MRHLLFCAVLLLTALAYLPGLPGIFVFDDYPNLLQHPAFLQPINDWHDLARVLREGLSGELGRPVSLLTFAANHVFSGGFDPLALKLTNLAIHLLNGGLLYLLAAAWAARLPGPGGVDPQRFAQRVGLVAMALWLLHPLNLTSVLYVVQRMTSLSATFVLLGLLGYTRARQAHAEGRSGALPLAAGLLLAWPAAVLAKESGVLLPLYALAVEAVVFRGLGARRARIEASTFLAVGLLPFVAALAYFVVSPGWILNGYAGREFDLVERLLTQARVLWFYVGLVVLPDIARLGLHHDDIALSTGWLEPVTTLFAVAGLAVVVTTAVVLRRRMPLLTFATAWFLVGHLIESTVIPLELVHEHRNYLPQAGILFAIAFALARVTACWRTWPVFPVALALALAGATAVRAWTWADYGRFIGHEVANHPGSAAANAGAIKWLVDTADRNPGASVDLLHRALGHVTAYERIAPGNPVPGLYRLLIYGRLALAGAPTPGPLEVDTLAQQLAEAAPQPLSITLLGYTPACLVSGRCAVPQEIVLALFEAALGNPRIGGGDRAYLLAARSHLHTAVTGDAAQALADIAGAARHDPGSSSYTRRWIERLAVAQRFAEARAALEAHGERLTPRERSELRRRLAVGDPGR